MEISYEPKGKLVATEMGQKLGKLTDYAVDSDTLYIKKIYVSPRLIKSLTGGQFSIDRSQIVEVTDKKIVVKDAVVKKSKKVNKAASSLASARAIG
jgi:uncharacterized protein YrrD